jgi:hypothetical protein
MTEAEYLNHIEGTIAEINAVNFNNTWAYEKIIHAILKIQKLPIILFILPKGSYIYRSRINTNSILFEKVSDISAPEDRFVIDYARANKPRQVLFYGSETRPTSYLEFASKLAETTPFGHEVLITVGAWELQKDIQLVLVYNPNAQRDNKYNQFHGAAFDEFIQKTPEALRKGTTKFFEFIGNKYGEQVKDGSKSYLITCAYSNIVFAYDQSDGIMYPSVPLGGDGFNVALKNNVILGKQLKLESARVDKFKAVQQENVKHEFVNIASMDSRKVDENNIEWTKEWQVHTLAK